MNTKNEHNLKINNFPERWLDGLPLGNGEIGVMLWGDEQSLKLSLDHANAWDTRTIEEEFSDPLFNYRSLREMVNSGKSEELSQTFKTQWDKNNPLGPTKINLGRLELVHNSFKNASFELSIDNAIASANLHSEKLEANFELFVSKDTNSIVARIENFPDNLELKYIPFYECTEEYKILGNPDAEITICPEYTMIMQQILPETYFGICYSHHANDLFVSFSYGKSAGKVKESALKKNAVAIAAGYEKLKLSHLNRWHAFWSKSAISIPEKEYERLWYYGLYILNSCSAKNMFPPGLQGVWATDGAPACWRGDYHADLNVQQTFAMACSANHVELLDVWLDYICGVSEQTKTFTRKFFGTKGAFQVCSTVPGHIPISGNWTPVMYAWSNTGWLAQLAWQRWRYSMDKKWLAEKGYPFVTSCFEFYAENLEMEDDGKYHIPLSSSPEYDNDEISAWCKDPNVDIALIRKCCDWVMEMEMALEISEFSNKAEEIKKNLVEYHLVKYQNLNYQVDCKKVLGLWKDKVLDESHRHPSHLMAIHPAMDITIDGGEEELQIIEDSLLQFLVLGQYFWCGHAYIQMISFAAVIGKANMAYEFLEKYFKNWTITNLLHHNRDKSTDSHFPEKRENLMTIEASCGVVEGINNMLLQSWNGIIRLFPAVPSHWRDISFSNMLTEGAFEVSASMQNGQVTQVTVKGIPGSICKIKNSFATQTVSVNGITQKMIDNIVELKIPSKGEISLTIG